MVLVNNYSDKARKSFRARHKCDTEKNKLSARYWTCSDLWTKNSSIKKCPIGKKCKY